MFANTNKTLFNGFLVPKTVIVGKLFAVQIYAKRYYEEFYLNIANKTKKSSHLNTYTYQRYKLIYFYYFLIFKNIMF